MVSLWNILVQLHKIAGPILMLVYPLYASVTALESPYVEDDTQWLTYWVLYSFIQLFDLGFSRILVWVPLWYTLKLVLVAWLVLPQFHGAEFVYTNFVKKFIGGKQHSTQNKKLSPKQRQLIDQMSPDARSSVAAFISEYGPEAFDSIITTATTQALKSKSPQQ